jgi:hypothetical protein
MPSRMNDELKHDPRPLFLTGWEGVIFELEDEAQCGDGLQPVAMATSILDFEILRRLRGSG